MRLLGSTNSVAQAVGSTSSSRLTPLVFSGSSRRFHFLLAADAARRQWNWPSSVEPVSAVVDDVGSTVVAIRSK
ncbi:hypothetical protein CKJ76_21340 [Mycobacterium avium]|nr:hypothetical protein BS641_23765 [Mycobacterium avium subsp. hominissuis]PAZ99197.1 hypothetical protein CKJ74_21220 [Mycobacterium avium]PBA04085.1 hypothetical protein CKJ73_21015 [Mycobacterium avium]PBA09288.1 hypothetical protein CKJ70_21715 [Mycobacterium avium]PBA34408.1 hypothetical protein CKJ64_21535 [Mycobacterium avium]